jgi:hypothetical protein
LRDKEDTEDEMEVEVAQLQPPYYKYQNPTGRFFLDGNSGIADYIADNGGPVTRKLTFVRIAKSKNGKHQYYVYKTVSKDVWFALGVRSFKVGGQDRYRYYKKIGNGSWKRITTHGGTSRTEIN